jgi:hypothetical protein
MISAVQQWTSTHDDQRCSAVDQHAWSFAVLLWRAVVAAYSAVGRGAGALAVLGVLSVRTATVHEYLQAPGGVRLTRR